MITKKIDNINIQDPLTLQIAMNKKILLHIKTIYLE